MGVKARLAPLLMMTVVGCSVAGTPPTTVAPPTTYQGTSAAAPTTTIALPRCHPGPPQPGFDLTYDRFLRLYGEGETDELVAMIGDGPVNDPWLDPGHDGWFPDIASWVRHGIHLEDRLADLGYSPEEPFHIFVIRSNDALTAQGIDRLSLTVEIWTDQDCELRVETQTPVAGPDPCRLDSVFPSSRPRVCEGPFPPRASHHSVWTGEEVLLLGGHTGDFGPREGQAGTVYDVEVDQVSQTSALPVDEPWNIYAVVWATDRAFVIGKPLYDPSIEDYRPTILAYVPKEDRWDTVARFPEGFEVIGAVVWTGADLYFAGGEINNGSDRVWRYTPTRGTWTELDSELPRVEGIEGVWTETEVALLGGYGGARSAYDPATARWRELTLPGVELIEYHELLWTGEAVIVAPLQTLTEDRGVDASRSLLVFDPASDTAIRTAEMPITPTIRGAVTWTGTELLIWGGIGDGRAHNEGAAYDPATDTWRVLAASPLGPRCDHSGTWTGQAWVIIGGQGACDSGGTALTDGAIYDPASDAWFAIGP